MITKTTYIAADGKEFDDERDCINYEEELKSDVGLSKAIELLKNYCNGRDCEQCLLGNNDFCRLTSYAPYEW